jgi:nucleotide-binding universal stress UspA family protein
LSKEVIEEYYQEEFNKVLAPVTEFLAKHGVNIQGVGKVGPAGETIAKLADEGQFDLLVMGTHGHGALGKLVMGSVSTQVLAHSTIPVLLVR